LEQELQALGVPQEYFELVYAGVNIGAMAGADVIKTAGRRRQKVK
jgi:hypothetical protein